MEVRMSATEARRHFGELLRRVIEDRTPVIVERGGKPQVVFVSLSEYERLRARQAERARAMEAGHEPDDERDRGPGALR